MYYTSAKKIVTIKRFFAENPDGKINTGMWTHPQWNKDEFDAWFIRCLHLKTGGQAMTEKDKDMVADYRIVKDYKDRRIARRGKNIMRTKFFAGLYPELHNPSNY